MKNLRKKSESGFSLIELMITISIIAILAAVALPAYQSQIRKGKRTEAQNLLLETASKQQRFFSQNMTYADVVGKLGYGAATNTSQTTGSGAYNVTVSAFTASSFTLLATPVAGTDQVNDGCGNLSITNTGQKGESGSLTVQDCWQ